jgi:hypothetical protein
MTGIGDARDENDARIAVDRARLSRERSSRARLVPMVNLFSR